MILKDSMIGCPFHLLTACVLLLMRMSCLADGKLAQQKLSLQDM